MRFRQLRRLLLGVGLAGLSACSNNPLTPCGNPQSAHYDLTISHPTPAMQLRIESCRVDADACSDLCNAAAQAGQVNGSVSKCDVSFDAQSAYVSIDAMSGGCVANAGGAGAGGPK